MDTTAVKKEDALRQKFVTALASLSGYYYPNPDDSPKPGPWDPIIKTAIAKFLNPGPQPWKAGPFPDPWFFGPVPDPWRIAAYRHPAIFDAIDPMSLVALNPQPLPPRESVVAEIARTAVERFALAQEIADMTNNAGSEQGIIIVGGKVSQFIDDFCGTVVPKKIPIPGPKGPEAHKFSGRELILAGLQFLNGTGSTANEALQREFQNAAEKLIDEGMRRT